MKYKNLQIGDWFIAEPLIEELDTEDTRPFCIFVKACDNQAFRLFDAIKSHFKPDFSVIKLKTGKH